VHCGPISLTFSKNIPFGFTWIWFIIIACLLPSPSSLLGNTPKDFDSFHSNLGEIEILYLFQTVSPPQLNTSPATAELTASVAKSEKENFESMDNGEEETTEVSIYVSLSDEEINDLLFGDLIDETDEPEIQEESNWMKFYLFELGIGHADNPLYAAYNPQSSGYAGITAESFFIHQSDPSRKALLYFYGEGKKFTELDEQDSSGLLLALLDYTYQPDASPFSFGQKLQHTYNSQGMDFSDLGTPNRTKITSNKSQVSTRMIWEDENQMKAVWEIGLGKSSLEEFADRSSEFSVGFTLGKKGNRWMNWEGKYFRKATDFKDRTAKDESGTEIDGKVKINESGASLSLEPKFENRFSQGTKVKTAFTRARNGDGGYYDFNRWKISVSKELEIDPWESTFSLGYKSTDYLERLTDKNEKFQKNGWNLDLCISRLINSDWKTFLKWTGEEDQSNDPDYSYQSNFWSWGLSWEK
jgi:hypothetical protein